jgi:type IV secretion system protein VirB3
MSSLELGLEVPLHASLANPVELGGAPRVISIVNATVAAVITLGLQEPLIGLPLLVIVHLIASFASRSDSYFHFVMTRHLFIPPYLDA